MVQLPKVYRQSLSNLLFNVDYTDYIAGAAYKRFYFLGVDDSVGKKYVLTIDSTIPADRDNYFIGGNGTDIDFDIEFKNPAAITSADATISYTVKSGANAFIVAWTIYHVTAGAVETSLGTVTDTTTTATEEARRTVKLPLTAKKIGVGEKLRVNVVITASDSAGNTHMFIDPSGRATVTEASTGATINSQSYINIPFKIDL